MFMKKGWLVLLGLFLVLFTRVAFAHQPLPSFPACDQQTENGNYAHYDYGMHQIVGNGLVEGSDDVYSLGDGNYFQCYCPVEGNNGMQTNWWQVPELAQELINNYVSDGWLFEASGTVWSLDSGPYLAKNVEFSCGGEPEPTPIPTATPTPVEGQPTSTPEKIGDANDCGAEARCAERPGPPACSDSQPKAPVLLSVIRSGNDGVDLVWSEIDDAEYYLISYGLEPGKPIYGVANTGKVQAYRIGSLDLKNKYYFTVRAHRGCAPSEASNELSYPNAIGGGMDFNLLKWLGGAVFGSGMVGFGGVTLRRKRIL